MKRLLFLLSPLRPSGLAFLGLGLILTSALIWYFFFSRPREEVSTLKLSMGREINPPKRLTKFFLDRSEAHRLKFEQVSTEGSEDSLEKINRGELDAAVVKGGLHLPKDTNVRQVTALDLETFHLLVKEKFAPDAAKNIGALKGKRININTPKTGTHYWSLDILKFAGLTPARADRQGNFTPVELGNPELLNVLAALEGASDKERARLIDDLPDAILLADLVPSPIVAGLVHQAHYRLLPLDFGPAYIQAFHIAQHDVLDAAAILEAVAILPYSYGVDEPVPKEQCPAIGLRRLLVARKDVPPQAVVRCLQLLYDEGPNTSLNFVEWGKFRPQYQLHAGVKMYDDERKHVLQNTIIKFLERLASVLGGIIGGILAIYGYFRWRRLLRFEYYFHEVRRIELIARGKQTDPDAPTSKPELLTFLHDRLSDLRTAAIAEFARGRMQGESLILSIFTLIQDTSTFLMIQLGEKK